MTSKSVPYHSGLSAGKLEAAPPLEGHYHDGRGNQCFVWDINDMAIPDAYRECDIVYAEPAWPDGLKHFDQRAGVSTPSYDAYALALGHIVRELGVPAIMFAPVRALRLMPTPDFSMEARLNGNKVPVSFWNGAMSSGRNHHDILCDVANRYQRIGDFCAGYGTTGRLFIEAGKNCVLSDYNPQCCGYIAENMAGWGT